MDNTQKFALVFVMLIYFPAFLLAITVLLIAVKLGILDEASAMFDFGIFLAICAITIPFVFGKVRKGISEGKGSAAGHAGREKNSKPKKSPQKARFRPERV
ncbi:MAG: hypothetical protein V1676_00405 [Candidatus Diapherotrites archaeon]